MDSNIVGIATLQEYNRPLLVEPPRPSQSRLHAPRAALCTLATVGRGLALWKGIRRMCCAGGWPGLLTTPVLLEMRLSQLPSLE